MAKIDGKRKIKVVWECAACGRKNHPNYSTCTGCAVTIDVKGLTPDPRKSAMDGPSVYTR